MNIKLPMWVLRRVVGKNPWLLSNSGVVSRSLVIDILFWEITVDSSWELLPEERDRLLKERDEAAAREHSHSSCFRRNPEQSSSGGADIQNAVTRAASV